MAASDSTKPRFKDTLNLPRTDFPIRANAAIDDPALIDRWQSEGLFSAAYKAHSGSTKFILHAGPPYANGHIHTGTAYNTILKDIIAKSRRMMGNHTPVKPGWDCHGLPIELKVTQEQPGLAPEQLKAACRAYALHWIEIQKKEFKRLGVLFDWDNPYITMDPGYEAATLRAFAQLVEHGYIERKNKTVPWCPSCKTVLATAEIEYYERKDPSVYVLFTLEQGAAHQVFPMAGDREVHLLVWTTTPWTLPLNRAVLLNDHADYVLLDAHEKLIIVAAAVADKVVKLLGIEKEVLHTFKAQELIDARGRAQHPFIVGFTVPLLLSPTVTLEDGTACVHCAPGCGPEDYEIGVKNNLEIFSPISPDGRYTAGIIPTDLEGMPVFDGQIWVIKKLASADKLFYKDSIRHQYPHCWRCRTPLIFRATKQWFCDLQHHGLKERAMQAVEHINMVPDRSQNRLHATIANRFEWCLSRQRIWGVPIPALLCTQCDTAYITSELVNRVADNVAREGIEFWDRASIGQVLPDGARCMHCGSTSFIKEHDILDVWFDSGISHYAVLEHDPELAFPADVYVEGKDQHRGWFQSSLLTSMILNNKAPMKSIVTHGYTVDAQGRKMSKSLGNVIAPHELIEQLGTDGLRLWVSSVDLASDPAVAATLFDNIKEVFRKIRITQRFVLSNLYDYEHARDALPVDQLLALDQYILHELYELNRTVITAYQQYDLTAVYHQIADFCAVNLSAWYLDIIKDRLYVEQADGPLRRSAQTASWYILDTLTRLIAPILSFTAEAMSDHYQHGKTESIHLQEFAHLREVYAVLEQLKTNFAAGAAAMAVFGVDQRAEEQVARLTSLNEHEQLWQTLKRIRSAVLKALEALREDGTIKHSLEASVVLCIDEQAGYASLINAFFNELRQTPQQPLAFLAEFFIVSQVTLRTDCQGLESTAVPGLHILAQKAEGTKCPRCWQWQMTQDPDGLCPRCQLVLGRS